VYLKIQVIPIPSVQMNRSCSYFFIIIIFFPTAVLGSKNIVHSLSLFTSNELCQQLLNSFVERSMGKNLGINGSIKICNIFKDKLI